MRTANLGSWSVPASFSQSAEKSVVPIVGPADWLANSREDDEWHIVNTRRPKKKPRVISFRYGLPDGSWLTDQENVHLYRTVKQVGVLLREGPHALADHLSPQFHTSFLAEMMHIIGWMRLNGIPSFSALTPSDVELLSENVVYGSATQIGAPERLTRALRQLISDGLLYTVVESQRSLRINRARIFAHASIPITLTSEPQLSAILRSVDNGLADGLTDQLSLEHLLLMVDYDANVLTGAGIRHKLQPLDCMWNFRRYIQGDNIGFDPFPGGLTARANELGTVVQRTRTVPSRQAMELVDRSIRWVMDYAEPILSAYDRAVSLRRVHGYDAKRAVALAVGEIGNCVSGPGAPWPIRSSLRMRDNDQSGVTLPVALRYLVVSCFIIIATFTGRRLDEILTIEAGCTHGDSKYGYWIRTYIEKTIQRVDETPCPAIVDFAVKQVLERLNRHLSAVGGDGSLCSWLAVDVDDIRTIRRLNPSEDLNAFARFVAISELSDGSVWRFSAHQFRRFFAIVYVWRYEYGDLGALAHHLRHFNLRMTQWYVTEAIAGLILEEEKALTKTVFCDAARGERQLGGPAGSRLTLMLNRAKTEFSKIVHIVLPSRLEKYIDRLVDKSRILLKSNPWSYCTCPMTVEAAGRANCRLEAAVSDRMARGPDLTGAKPDTCAGCVFNLTDARRRPVIEREIFQSRRRLLGCLPILARNAEEGRLRRLERYIEDFPIGRESE